MTRLLAVAVVVTTALTGCLEPDPHLKEKRALLGSWLVVYSEQAGENVNSMDLDGLDLIFEEGVIMRRELGSLQKTFSYQIDPTQRPRAIDLTILSGPKQGRTDRGIYEIEGKVLRICIQEDKDGPRPTKFVSPKGSTLSLVELRRSN